MRFNRHKAKKLLDRGQAQDAADYTRGVIKKNAAAFEAHEFMVELGLVFNQLPVAQAHLKILQQRAPGTALTEATIGRFLLVTQKPAQGAVYYESALSKQVNAEWFVGLGLCFVAQRLLNKALEAFKKAYDLNPTDASVCYNYAATLVNKESGPQTYEMLKTLLETCLLKPDYRVDSVMAYNNLARAHIALGEVDLALHHIQICQQQSETREHQSYTLSTHMMLNLAQGDMAAALEKVQGVYDLQPDDKKSSNTLIKFLLLLEDYPAAWKVLNQQKTQVLLAREHTIFIRDDEGIGDQILTISLLFDLQQKYPEHQIICAVDQRLMALVQRSFTDITVIDRQSQQSTTQPVQHILTCKHIAADLRPDVASFPEPRAFLKTEPNHDARAQNWLSQFAGQKVGFNWYSKRDAYRVSKSPQDLGAWLPLLKTPGIAWVDVQYGSVEQDRAYFAEHGIQLHQHPDIDLMDDIDALVAVLKNLDALVTISNSTAHLAGGLGLETHLLLSAVPIWHWGTTQDHSLWYPNMTIYRTYDEQDWPSQIQAVARTLSGDVL